MRGRNSRNLWWLLALSLVLAFGPQGSKAAPAGAPVGGVVAQSQGISVNPSQDDPENRLRWCNDPNAHTTFGDSQSYDKGRCFTFRYSVPAGGVTSASLHVAVEPLGGLSDNDTINLAVAQHFERWDWALGDMPGVVVLHGAGFGGGKPSYDTDLFNINCDKSLTITPEEQQAVIEQLQTGVMHFALQDDTAVFRAQLVLNGPSIAECGQSDRPGTPGVAVGGTGDGTDNPGGTSSSLAKVLPIPPFGSPEPASVSGMALQVGQRRVFSGEFVEVPIWLINGADIANMNFTVSYDSNVVSVRGELAQGYAVDTALFSGNVSESGLIRAGFAQTSGLSGTGVVAYIPFVAVGAPGDKTPLRVDVTTLNNPAGTVLPIGRIDGMVEIIDSTQAQQGDCDGDGIFSSLDALCALQMSVNSIASNSLLDLDGSGDVTSRDATLILQRVQPYR